MLSKKLHKNEKKVLAIISLLIISLVALSYLLNTIYIKPQLNEKSNWFSFFMINYFNDVGAGMMIAAFSNLLFIIKKRRYISSLKFYLFLALIECIIWEIIRPFILMIFNPFNKNPKFLWGDMIAYAIGTLIIYLIFSISFSRVNNELKRTK